MKKKFLLAITLCLLPSSTTFCSTDNINKDSQKIVSHQTDLDDDFDLLIEEALENNLIKDVKTEEPSKLSILAQKVGIVLFLKPYIFMITKYRCVKAFIKTYAQKMVAYFSKKETEAKANEQS